MSIPTVAYQNEIVAPTENTTYGAKIGLIYVSDYGFAASPNAWSTRLENYGGTDANGTSIERINWVHMGFSEVTISRESGYSSNAFFVKLDGDVYYNYVGNGFGVRPVFNLMSTVTYVSGSGTQSDPIRIN